MARPLRIEFAGAWYHVMNRGAGGRVIYPNDLLRNSFLELLEDIHFRIPGTHQTYFCQSVLLDTALPDNLPASEVSSGCVDDRAHNEPLQKALRCPEWPGLWSQISLTISPKGATDVNVFFSMTMITASI